jgi:hypothetical protein
MWKTLRNFGALVVGKNLPFWNGTNDTLDIGVHAFCVVGIGPNHEFVNFLS